MAFNAKVPYNDLPPFPPEVDVETKTILKETIAARSALAELKGPGETIPNQALLVDSLILQEAKASSEIENIITTSVKITYRKPQLASKVLCAGWQRNRCVKSGIIPNY